jgi:L-asparaginase
MIEILITGGTFDKEYDYVTGELFFRKTHLEEMLKRGRSTLDVKLNTLMMKDSLDMNSEDRAIIGDACDKSSTDKILITHGTDTMVETAEVLAARNLNKKIVITGALIPYAFGNSSDGFFNLGSALGFIQVLSPGVYIVMNGRYFTWDGVKKNRQTGFFEPKLTY